MKSAVAAFIYLSVFFSGQAFSQTVKFEELDFFAANRWYLIRNQPVNRGISFRLYAGLYQIREDRMFGGLANVITCTCSRAGNSYSISFPPYIFVEPLNNLNDGDGLTVTFRQGDREVKLQARRSHANNIYFDAAGNRDALGSLDLALLTGSIMTITARGSSVAAKLSTSDNFTTQVDRMLRSNQFAFEKLDDFEMGVKCLEARGLRLR